MTEGNIIKHDFIDFKRYEEILNQSPFESVFMEPWVLNILSPNWGLLVYGDYETIMPVSLNKKFVIPFPIQPPFLQQFSFLGDTKNRVFLLKLLSKKYLRGCINLGNFDSVLGDDFSVRKRPNYILNLNKPLNELEKGFSKDALKNLRKLKEIGYQSGVCSAKIAIDTYRNAWGKLNNGLTDKHYETLKLFVAKALENNRINLKAIFASNGELLAAGAFLIGKNRIHYILGGPTELGKTEGATHALIYEIIKEYSYTKMVLDFEGSSIEGVAYFYQKFGALNEPFSQISWSKIPFDSL